MKKELIDNQLEEVVGGTVIISKDAMKVGFSTMGQMFSLKNCTYRQARNLVDDLLDANPNMTNSQFDQYCKKELQAKGWI